MDSAVIQPTRPVNVLSYGGGTQSIYQLILIIQGILPRPDIILMVDTGREAESTWAYMDKHIKPLLDEHKLKIEVIRTKDWITESDFDVLEQRPKKNEMGVRIPAYHNNGGGKFTAHCSGRWKKAVVSKYLRDKGVRKCNLWIGFSSDELSRVKPSGLKWQKRCFPLVNGFMRMQEQRDLFKTTEGHYDPTLPDLKISRDQCIKGVMDFGLPEPPKSSCYCCPHRSAAQWKQTTDAELAQCVAIEQRIQQADTHTTPWLTEFAMPVDEVVGRLRAGTLNSQKPKKADDNGNCQSGLCLI